MSDPSQNPVPPSDIINPPPSAGDYGSQPSFSGATPIPPAAYYPGSQQPAGPKANTLAIISLIAGIASFFIFQFIGGLAAIITGHIALGRIRRSGEAGRGMALTGTILGYVNVVGSALVGIFLIIVFVIAAPHVASAYEQAQQQYDQCVAAANGDADAMSVCADQLSGAYDG